MIAGLVAAAILMTCTPAAPARPNIVLILMDDLRHDALGCTGSPLAKTPHIDRLAAEGARFRNAFATTPLCSPSRASILTGQYTRTHGVQDNTEHGTLSHALVTWPRLLHEAGYDTAFVGKWHMGKDDSPRPGFDRWVSFRNQGVYADPPLNVDGQAVAATGYTTDILTDYAVEFLGKPRSRPFCLFLAHKAVHDPPVPAERHRGLYADSPLTPPPSARDTLEGKPAVRRALRRRDPDEERDGKRDEDRRQAALSQLRMLAAADEGVGRILKVLEQTKALDRTVIIFTSDNGYLWGEHGLDGKCWAYEDSIRIPLLVRYPPLVRPGSTPEALALGVDIAPTALEIAGATAPRSFHGRSLVRPLSGETAQARESFLAEFYTGARVGRVPTWTAVRTSHWKLIRYAGQEDADELYDLPSDPIEMKNLARHPAAQSKLTEMRELMARHERELRPR